MKVREVFAGSAAQPRAEFVELQLWNANHNLVGGKRVAIYSANGTFKSAATFPADVSNGLNQASILIATTQAESFFGVQADLEMNPGIPTAAGKVCWENPVTATIIDCLSWGNFTGPNTESGNPLNPTGGLTNGLSALRDISAGDPNLLENPDDTGDSAADFDLQPNVDPRSNSNATTTRGGGVTASGGQFNWDAATGDVQNKLTLSGPAGGFYTFQDTAAPVAESAGGCERVLVDSVRCDETLIGVFSLSAGTGNDSVNASGVPLSIGVTGSLGNDKLTTGGGQDQLFGGDQNDTLVGGNNLDFLSGGANTDLLDGGAGPDDFNGGLGNDTATYAARGGGVTVDIDGVDDDGNSSDGAVLRDNVGPETENIIGGGGADSLTGDNTQNKLTGNGGEDSLFGLGGRDTIFAEDGLLDHILCGTEPDDLFADDALDDFPVAGPDACETVN